MKNVDGQVYLVLEFMFEYGIYEIEIFQMNCDKYLYCNDIFLSY